MALTVLLQLRLVHKAQFASEIVDLLSILHLVFSTNGRLNRAVFDHCGARETPVVAKVEHIRLMLLTSLFIKVTQA